MIRRRGRSATRGSKVFRLSGFISAEQLVDGSAPERRTRRPLRRRGTGASAAPASLLDRARARKTGSTPEGRAGTITRTGIGASRTQTPTVDVKVLVVGGRGPVRREEAPATRFGVEEDLLVPLRQRLERCAGCDGGAIGEPLGASSVRTRRTDRRHREARTSERRSACGTPTTTTPATTRSVLASARARGS